MRGKRKLTKLHVFHPTVLESFSASDFGRVALISNSG